MKAFIIFGVLSLVFGGITIGSVLWLKSLEGSHLPLAILAATIFAIGIIATIVCVMGSLCMIFSPGLRREITHGPYCNCQKCVEERRIAIFLPPS